MSKLHELKCDSKPFQDVWDGNKKAELRIDDGRGFEVGDKFKLKETNEDRSALTGREVHGSITHIVDVGDWVKVDCEHPVLMISIQPRELVESLF